MGETMKHYRNESAESCDLIRTLEAENAALEAEVSKGHADVAGYTNQLLESQVACQKLEQENAALKEQNGSLKANLQLYVDMEKDIADLRDRLDRAKKTLYQLQEWFLAKAANEHDQLKLIATYFEERDK